MKHEAEIKELLIHNAIHLIAEGGFERATVKELTTCGGSLPGFKMNDVYIYRLFGSKEGLYAATFARLDSEVFYHFRKAYTLASVQTGESADLRTRIGAFFAQAWSFLMNDEEKCRCYVRFYYSVYFTGAVAESHRELFSGMIGDMSSAFREEADVVSIVHSVFTAMFNFAIRVYNGDLLDNEVNRLHIYNVLYNMMVTYFKEPSRTVAGTV